MRKLTSTSYSEWAFNLAMLVLRVGFGVLIVAHGYEKLVHFDIMSTKFLPFLGLSPKVSLILSIFAEFFCGLFLIIGLFTRLVAIPLIINMLVALSKVHNWDVFSHTPPGGQPATLYLLAFIIVLLCGPGRASVDGMIK